MYICKAQPHIPRSLNLPVVNSFNSVTPTTGGSCPVNDSTFLPPCFSIPFLSPAEHGVNDNVVHRSFHRKTSSTECRTAKNEFTLSAHFTIV